MSNRFHNKIHANNHHTDPTDGDINSATDPIASEDKPFIGDFHIDGDWRTGVFNTITTDILGNVISTTGDAIVLKSNLDFDTYEPENLPIDLLTDVNITSVTSGDLLKFDGNSWVNSQVLPSNSVDASVVDTNFLGGELELYQNKIRNKGRVPVGSVIMWMHDNIPEGWMVCDGSSLDVNSYSELFDKLKYYYGGSFNLFKLPDMRGLFIRGVNGDRSDTYADKSPNRKVGNIQDADEEEHTHEYIAVQGRDRQGNRSQDCANYQLRTLYTEPNSGVETRPDNMVAYFIIKVT